MLQIEAIHDVKQALVEALGSGAVSSASAVCNQHSRDEGVERSLPVDLVVWPSSTEEVAALAAICYEKNIPMIPYGTGTGLESGVCAVQVKS